MVKYLRDTSHIFVYSEIKRFDETVHSKREADILNICDELDSLVKTVDQTDLRFSDINDYIIRLSKLGTYPMPDDVRLVAKMFFDAGRLDSE